MFTVVAKSPHAKKIHKSFKTKESAAQYALLCVELGYEIFTSWF